MTYHLVPAADIARAHAESAGEQYRSGITQLADGGALVVFEQRVRPDPDLYIYDVEVSAQRYDATGAAQGGLISLARLEGLPQSQTPSYHPFATGLEGGGYAIGWHDRGSGDLRVQTYDAGCGLLGDVLLPLPPRYLETRDQYVDVTASGGQHVAIAALDNGGFSVTWDAGYSGILAQYVGASTIYTQTFAADGSATSAPAQIMPWVGSVSYGWDLWSTAYDAVAVGDGQYLVVMRAGEGAPGNAADHPAVVGRIFANDGSAVTGNFMISQSLETWADYASVDVLTNGDFVVAWRSGTTSMWRRFDEDGTPLTDEVPLTRQYRDVEVTAMPDGGFLIGAQFVPSGSVAYSTHAYRFDADNTLVDGDRFVFTERRVPDYDTNYYAQAPEFAVLGNGQLLGLVEGHASWNGNDWEVFTWRQLAEELGSTGNDTLTANDDGMALFGLGGDDSLQGSAAADFLDGGAGNDTLIGGAGNDTLVAGDGSDLMQGGAGDDTFFSGPGDNTIQGGDGTDRVILDGVRASGVTVRGPADNLVITYEGSRTDVTGVEHFEFRSGSFSDDLTLEDMLPLRNSTIIGTDDNDTLIGDYGDDLIYGNGGNDLIEGGEGNDRLYGRDGDDTLIGGLGNDSLDGGNGDDLLSGGAGDDTLYGGYGNDTLDGGDGHDLARVLVYSWSSGTVVTGPEHEITISSGRGVDVFRNIEAFEFTDGTLSLEEVLALRNLDLTGTAGDDTLIGDYGDDVLSGVGGNNLLDGGAGDDTLTGGTGSDTMLGGAGNDLLIGGDGFDTLDGGDGADTLLGNAGNDSLLGGAGDDLLNGGIGFDELHGDAGDDTLIGGDGFDTLYGGDGDDSLQGNAGNDELYGGDRGIA
ncbi:calcium-binding protein, partial [Lacimonas salitolerans]